MAKKTIALFHPGNMGATIGAAAAASGARVLWASHERGAVTRRRAERAGLFDAGTLADALRQADVVLSVCPPHAALDVARAVAAERFSGIYVDANAVSRATAEQIGAIVGTSGASFVDGGIIGAPVQKAGTTRLYLSGPRASEVAALFSRQHARRSSDRPRSGSSLGIEGHLRRLDKMHRRFGSGNPCIGHPRRRRPGAARRMVDFPAGARKEMRTRRGGRRAEGMALRRRNARDRRGVRGRRLADGLSPRGR